jgi:putative endonuclease
MESMSDRQPPAQGHFMYVLRCADGSLYTGYTVDVARRLRQHEAGTASRYTRARRPVSLEGWWQFDDKRSAMQAEWNFKQLTRSEKLRLLQAGIRTG